MKTSETGYRKKPEKQVRLFGRLQNEEMVEQAIMNGQSLPSLDRLDSAEVQRLTETAIEHENLPALVSLAKINRYAVSNSLSMDKMISLGRIAGKGGVTTPRFYFVMRGVVDNKRRKIFRRLARTSILKLSLRIAGEGLRGDVVKHSQYDFGGEFDMEATMETLLEEYPLGIPTLTARDIIGIEKVQRKKTGVLIIDASGSMMGDRNTNGALASAIMAYAMRKDEFAVIAFNTKAFVIKKLKERVKIQEIVDRILDLESVGHTNIEDALKVGSRELRKIHTRYKWAILMTDGVYNKGKDPRYLCREFPKLHVINLPGKKWGQKVCQDLARLGGGKYVAVRRYREVPRALMKILRTPW